MWFGRRKKCIWRGYPSKNIKLFKKFEKKNSIKVIEVSAKSGNQVEDAFKQIVENLITKKYILNLK